SRARARSGPRRPVLAATTASATAAAACNARTDYRGPATQPITSTDTSRYTGCTHDHDRENDERAAAEDRGAGLVGETGFEPATPWSRTKSEEHPGLGKSLQPAATIQDREEQTVQASSAVASFSKRLAAGLLLTGVAPLVDQAD